MTTEQQIQRARGLAESIKKINGVHDAQVDDWDDDGNFNIFVYPRGDCRSGMIYFEASLRGLLVRIKSLIKQVGYFEWADGPRRQYKGEDGRRYFDGYDRNNYKLSVYIPNRR